MKKYILAFGHGILGAILSLFFLWLMVFDSNAPVYTFTNSLPEIAHDPVKIILYVGSIIIFVTITYAFARFGYLVATEEGRVRLDAEHKARIILNNPKNPSNNAEVKINKIENYLVKLLWRVGVGLLVFVIFILVYKIMDPIYEINSLLGIAPFFIFVYLVGYAVLRLWNLTWGKKLKEKLDGWKWSKEGKDA